MSMIHIKDDKFSYRFMLRLICFYYVFTQIISVLRATSIYNTSYIANVLRAGISGLFIILFLLNVNYKRYKFGLEDIIYFGIPVLAIPYGLLHNQFGRDFLSDFFTAISFAVIFNYYKHMPPEIKGFNLSYLAHFELWGTFVSLVIYKLFPLFGIPIRSVGNVSNFLLFPLAYFLAYGNKLWILSVALIFLGGKRGVMLSAIALICFFYITDKRDKLKTAFVIISAVSMVALLLFFTSTPERISALPSSFQRVGSRFMKVNPFSEYRDWYSDGRLDEILGAIRQFDGSSLNLLFGKGNGFVYTVYHNGLVRFSNRHNVHFTPVAFLTRYGLIYTLVFYRGLISCLVFGIKYLKKNKEHRFVMCLLLYLFGTFVDQFTAFLPYADYQFMMCFGFLRGLFHSGRRVNHEELYERT